MTKKKYTRNSKDTEILIIIFYRDIINIIKKILIK
jgi:hypothetical protein